MSRRPANNAPSSPDKPGKGRRPWRTAVVLAGIVAVLIAALGIGYRVTQAYYFVGRDGAEVAIFRGVNTQFGPLKFFDVYKNTDLKMKDLQPAVRSQVQDGITARNESDAEQIVGRLHDQLLPICRLEVPPTPSPTPTTTHSRSSARTTAKAGTKTTARTTPKPTASSSARTSATPTPTETPATNPVPDVNCRAA
jgi:PPM family protein phosphatase